MKVLLMEDDKYLGEALKEYLEREGFECKWLEDDRDFFLVLNSAAFDIVVLDLILKYKSGEELLKKLKEKYSLPVIVVTAKGKIEAKEVCFALGADDYITKPFNPKELVLRINSVCRRYYSLDVVRAGDLEIDLEKKTVKKSGKDVKLTNKDWQLLELLVKNRGKVVSTSTILNYVWPDGEVGEESIRTYIKRLRFAIGEKFIKNLKGRGYMFSE